MTIYTIGGAFLYQEVDMPSPFIEADRLAAIRNQIATIAFLTDQEPYEVAATILESFMTSEDIQKADDLEDLIFGEVKAL